MELEVASRVSNGQKNGHDQTLSDVSRGYL